MATSIAVIHQRLRTLFPLLLHETSANAFRSEGPGVVNKRLSSEAQRCLLALNCLSIVDARVKHRCPSTAGLVAIAIAVSRGVGVREDDTLDLKAAVWHVRGANYNKMQRLDLWRDRLKLLVQALENLSIERLFNLESHVANEETKRSKAAQQGREQRGVCYECSNSVTQAA